MVMERPRLELKKSGDRLFLVVNFAEAEDVGKTYPMEVLPGRAVLEITRDLILLDLEKTGLERPYRVIKAL